MANPQPDKYFKMSVELWDAICKASVPADARQVFDAIVRMTYGHRRKADRITTQDFIRLTGLSESNIHKARKRLIRMKMIRIDHRGKQHGLTYSIQKDYDQWHDRKSGLWKTCG